MYYEILSYSGPGEYFKQLIYFRRFKGIATGVISSV